eukprot:358848-Chlamydomonas_euryale.AAC.4
MRLQTRNTTPAPPPVTCFGDHLYGGVTLLVPCCRTCSGHVPPDPGGTEGRRMAPGQRAIARRTLACRVARHAGKQDGLRPGRPAIQPQPVTKWTHACMHIAYISASSHARPQGCPKQGHRVAPSKATG